MSTNFPIATTSDVWDVEAIGLGEEPRLREGKVAPTGEPTYASGCLLRVMRKDGALKADKSASVHVLEPAAVYELGVIYRAQGRVYIQPYMSGEGASARLAYSITCQRLVPVTQVTAKGDQGASKTESGKAA